MNVAHPAAHAAAILLAFGAGLAAPVLAEAQTRGTETRLVRHDDLDLSRPAGRDQLQRRVQAAAVAVCGGKPYGPVERVADHRTCVETAKARVQPQVDRTIAAATAAGALRAALDVR